MITLVLLCSTSASLVAQIFTYGVSFDNQTSAYFVAEVHTANSGAGNECGGSPCTAQVSTVGPHYDVPDNQYWEWHTFEDQSGNAITNANLNDLIAIRFKEYFGNAWTPTQVHTLSFCPDDLTVTGSQICGSFSNHYGAVFFFEATIGATRFSLLPAIEITITN